MEIAKEALILIILGFTDCFRGIFKALLDGVINPLLNCLYNILTFFKNSKNELSRENVERISAKDSPYQGSVKSKLCECFAFGLFFLLSVLTFNHILFGSAFANLVEWAGEDVESYTILRYFLHIMFCILWIFPLLCLSRFLNFNWYQDIANCVLLESGQKKHEDVKMSDFYADQIKSLILQMIFCVQGCIVFIPDMFGISNPLPWSAQFAWYMLHCSLLSSLYAFEYKWVYRGWPLHRRLSNICTKWPYYLAFGSPLALINYFCSFTVSLIVFSTCFPLYVISSSVTEELQRPPFRYALHIFKFADWSSEWIIKLLF